MRIAIPLTEGRLSQHFGHCQQFAVVDIDSDNKKISNKENFVPPAHEPGVLPKWLSGIQVNLVITGGMGQRAQQLFEQSGVSVLVGAPSESPEEIVEAYLGGTLVAGENICDH